MTERGGGPPSSQQQSRTTVTSNTKNNNNHNNSSQYNPYHHGGGQINDRKQSQMQQQQQLQKQMQHQQQQYHQHHSTMHQFGASGSAVNAVTAAQSSQPGSQYQSQQSTNNHQLQVSSDLKLMNLTQAQINVSKMIQSRDSEAARKALEMSKQVQSNTMLVSDQIARIQHQVQMQKQKANKAAAEEQFYHASSSYHHSQNPSQHQFQQQQMGLQRNPLSGTIQMNVKNSMSKPVQPPQPYNAVVGSGPTATVAAISNNQMMVQSPLIGAAAAVSSNSNKINQFQVQQYMSQPSQQAAMRKAVNQSDLLKAQSTGNDHKQYNSHIQHHHGNGNNANASIVRISKKPSSYSHHRQHHKQAAPAADHQMSPGVASGNNSKLIKLKAPQVQTLNNQQTTTTVQKQSQLQTSSGAGGAGIVSVTNTNNTNATTTTNQAEQGQLEERSSTNRVRPSYPSQLSQQQNNNNIGSSNNYPVRPSNGGANAHHGGALLPPENRRKASLGHKELQNKDIMPAQQSNISAEDLDDDEGRIKEIPRQSVLSNLVESSISNFENEESVEDGGPVDENEKGATVAGKGHSQKNIIRIEKQGSIDTGSKQHYNLKSRKSQKQDHVVRRNMMLAGGAGAGKSNQRKRIIDEPIVVNSVHDVGAPRMPDRDEKNSSIHRGRKDIDSDNKSEVSDEAEGADVRSGIRKRKQNSIMALRRKKLQQQHENQQHRRDKNNISQVSSSTKKAITTGPGSGNPTVIALNAGALATSANNSQDPIEIRGVETIEEFFRPEFAQNTQSLDDINDDSDNRSDDDNVTDGGIAKMIQGLDADNAAKSKNNRSSKMKKQSASSKMAPFPPFSDNDNSGIPSSDSDQSQVDIGNDHNKAQFRNMGFPNMNYLDPEANGPPLQTQTYYKNFEEDQDNDIKAKREEMSNARDNMPNNTFIKLFHFLNADAGEAGGANGAAALGGADTEDDAHLHERNAYGASFDQLNSGGNQGGGPRGNKQDELQSIQYVDVNYVESSMETDNEAAMANFNREIASPAGGDVRIIYNPAKNKSKSLGRVGLADQLNQFHSMNQDGDKVAANPNSQLRQRKGSMLGGIREGVSDKNQSHGRRQRIKANSSEKLPPLLSNKIITENGSGSRKRLIQPPEIGGQYHHQQPHSEKGGNGGGNQSRQKTRAVAAVHHNVADHQNNQDSQASIFLKQALGNDLVPINFEMKGGRVNKQQLGEVSAKARLNGNLTTINGGAQHQNDGQHVMHQRHMQEQHLKSSSNPSLRPNQGRSGSINVDLVAKHSISTSNQGVGNKHPKMSFMTSDHNMYQHHQGGFKSPQQANPAISSTDHQDSNLPPILKNQENYFSRNGAINQVNSGQQPGGPNNPGASGVTSGQVETGGPAAVVANHQKHFGMMHKRIENQNHYHGVFSGGASAGPGSQHQGQIVSNFMQHHSPAPPNALQLQQSPVMVTSAQHHHHSQQHQQQTASNSPTNRNNGVNAEVGAGGHQQFFHHNHQSDRRAPIKAFPTPLHNNGANSNNSNNQMNLEHQYQQDESSQHVAATQSHQQPQPAGEEEMQEFVNDFERATMSEKAHEQMLCLKKIRLHHKVLAKISFNAYKFVIEYSQVIKVHEGETLFAQGHSIDQIYFVLYGALMVTIQNTQNKQRVGDVVRGGNVLGEEAFFCQDAVYKETAVAHTQEVGLIQVDAVMLSGLGAENFKGKGQNMLAYQRDFRALFQVLKEIYGTKEAWRSRAQSLLAKQSYNLKIINLD